MTDISKLLQPDAPFELYSLTATDDGPLRKIEQFANLRHGWRFGEGIPPTAETIRAAKSILLAMQTGGFKVTDAFVEVGGDISVTAYHTKAKKGYKHYIEFTIEATGQINATREEGRNIVDEQDGLTLNAAKTLLRKWRNAIFSTSESFPSKMIGIQSLKDSGVLRSRSQATTAARPLSDLIVLSSTQEGFVPTSKDFTRSFENGPMSGGWYQPPYSQAWKKTLSLYQV